MTISKSLSNIFRVWKWCYIVILQLDPGLRTHPLMSHVVFSESGRGAVRAGVGSSTVRRPQSTDVTGHGSEWEVPCALLDVYRYVCLSVCLSVCACDCLSVCACMDAC